MVKRVPTSPGIWLQWFLGASTPHICDIEISDDGVITSEGRIINGNDGGVWVCAHATAVQRTTSTTVVDSCRQMAGLH